VCAALLLEGLIPGAVLPFLDIVPLSIIALILLVYDAVRRPGTRTIPWAAGIGACICAMILVSILLLTTPGDGRAGIIALAVLAIGILSLAFWPRE
jgi:hypothetical protein